MNGVNLNITGTRRDCEDLASIASSIVEGSSVKVALDKSLLNSISKARYRYLEEARRRRIYGYCTGLGELYEVSSSSCPKDWEERVLLEHSAQVGNRSVPPEVVRLFLFIRILQLTRAPAPVRPVVVDRLAKVLTGGLTPLLYAHGSVGASGDLSPSAQASLCIYYGKGGALLDCERVDCQEALKRLGLDILPLEAGEALFLINNTAWSTALCLAGLTAYNRLLAEVTTTAGDVVSVSRASREHYDEEAVELKNCPEGAVIARQLIGYATSEPRLLQAPYSIRCIPQILGTLQRAGRIASQLLVEEACASTENPTLTRSGVRHTCNFHSVKVALACSMLQESAAYLSILLERLAAQLLRSKVTGLPEFLAGEGSSVGAMIAHYTVAALSARVRALSIGASRFSTPTSGLQEDIVPMAPEGGILLLEMLQAIAAQLGGLRSIINRARRLATGEKGPYRSLQEEIMRETSNVRRTAFLDRLTL
jgi:histidine ammonia-lyase